MDREIFPASQLLKLRENRINKCCIRKHKYCITSWGKRKSIGKLLFVWRSLNEVLVNSINALLVGTTTQFVNNSIVRSPSRSSKPVQAQRRSARKCCQLDAASRLALRRFVHLAVRLKRVSQPLHAAWALVLSRIMNENASARYVAIRQLHV